MHSLARLTLLAFVARAMELVLDESVLVSRLSVLQVFRSLAGLLSLRSCSFALPAYLLVHFSGVHTLFVGIFSNGVRVRLVYFGFYCTPPLQSSSLC